MIFRLYEKMNKIISLSLNEASNEGEKYEHLICFSYNFFNKASKENKKFKSFEDAKKDFDFFEEFGKDPGYLFGKDKFAICKKIYEDIARNVDNKDLGMLRKLGTSEVEVSSDWVMLGDDTPDKTPKTDIISSKGNKRFSVKIAGGSQLMSGSASETYATFVNVFKDNPTVQEQISTIFSGVSNKDLKVKLHGNVSQNKKAIKVKNGENLTDSEAALMKIEEIKKSWEILVDLLNSNEKYKMAFLKEAASGKIKFGNGPGTANLMLKVFKDGNVEIYSIDEYLKKEKFKIYVAFKSNSISQKDQETKKSVKTGDYSAYLTFRIGS